MQRLIILAIAITLNLPTSNAADRNTEQCLSGSGIGSFKCAETELSEKSKQLHSTYKNLLKAAKENEVQSPLFEQSQRDWLKHVKSTCNLVSTIFGGEPVWMLSRETWCKVHQYEAREKELNGLLLCFTQGGSSCP